MKILIKEIKVLVFKEFLLEWRQKYALNGILLYLVSIIFICYLSFKKIDAEMWVSLYWIILLFIAINSLAKSFLLENKNNLLFLYSLAHPVSVIISKTIYNTFLMMFLALISLVFYTFIIGNPINNLSLFMVNLILGACCISANLTFISAISHKASNSAMLMAVLSFPVLLPVLLICIRTSILAINQANFTGATNNIITLACLFVIILMLQIILFPFLWRE